MGKHCLPNNVYKNDLPRNLIMWCQVLCALSFNFIEKLNIKWGFCIKYVRNVHTRVDCVWDTPTCGRAWPCGAGLNAASSIFTGEVSSVHLQKEDFMVLVRFDSAFLAGVPPQQIAGHRIQHNSPTSNRSRSSNLRN